MEIDELKIKDWKEEACRNMVKYATKDSEKFNFWHGFSSGLDKAESIFKDMLEDLSKQLVS